MERQVDLAAPGLFPAGSLVFAIVAGVALFVALGVLRTAFRFPLVYLLIPSYIVLLSWLRFATLVLGDRSSIRGRRDRAALRPLHGGV